MLRQRENQFRQDKIVWILQKYCPQNNNVVGNEAKKFRCRNLWRLANQLTPFLYKQILATYRVLDNASLLLSISFPRRKGTVTEKIGRQKYRHVHNPKQSETRRQWKPSPYAKKIFFEIVVIGRHSNASLSHTDDDKMHWKRSRTSECNLTEFLVH